MAICKACNAEIGEARFCPLCGASQEVSQPVVQPVIQPEPLVVSQPVPAPEPVVQPVVDQVVTPLSSYTTQEPVAQPAPIPTPVYTPPQEQVTYAPPVNNTYVPPVSVASGEFPKPTGQVVFAIINILLGIVLCCCYGVSLVSMVLGIIALVMATGSKKAATAEEAMQKIKNARLMNIIGLAFLLIAIIIFIVMSVRGNANFDALNDFLYEYGYEIG